MKDQDPSVEVILKRFESPDETRIMEKGRFELGYHRLLPRPCGDMRRKAPEGER